MTTPSSAGKDTDAQPTGGALAGKLCVVTGGAKGIGAAVTRRLAAAGARVVVVDRDSDAARDLAASVPRCDARNADIGDYESVRHVLEAVGPVDFLVNNAGWDRVQPFLHNDPALWHELIAVNLLGIFNSTHLALPKMIAAGTGRILNVASDAGRVGSSGEAVYSACKGGAIAFTKSIAREVARHRIPVNCVCPGPTDTALMAEITSDEQAARTMDAIVKATPMRRLASSDDVAGAICFFASAPTHVTGQVLSVSGGLTMAG